MRIRAVFVDRDKTYLSRLVTTLNAKMSDKLEARSFSEPEYMYDYVKDIKSAVVIVNEEIPVDFEKIPESVSFGYLVEMGGIAECRGQKAI